MSKVIVTLTTIPSRIIQDYDSGIKSNIDSLINQDYEGEYEIHFNVPTVLKYTGVEYVIPEWLKELAATNPKFKIFEEIETESKVGMIFKISDLAEKYDDRSKFLIDFRNLILGCDIKLFTGGEPVELKVEMIRFAASEEVSSLDEIQQGLSIVGFIPNNGKLQFVWSDDSIEILSEPKQIISPEDPYGEEMWD